MSKREDRILIDRLAAQHPKALDRAGLRVPGIFTSPCKRLGFFRRLLDDARAGTGRSRDCRCRARWAFFKWANRLMLSLGEPQEPAASWPRTTARRFVAAASERDHSRARGVPSARHDEPHAHRRSRVRNDTPQPRTRVVPVFRQSLRALPVRPGLPGAHPSATVDEVPAEPALLSLQPLRQAAAGVQARSARRGHCAQEFAVRALRSAATQALLARNCFLRSAIAMSRAVS